jgi:hypothetical protein
MCDCRNSGIKKGERFVFGGEGGEDGIYGGGEEQQQILGTGCKVAVDRNRVSAEIKREEKKREGKKEGRKEGRRRRKKEEKKGKKKNTAEKMVRGSWLGVMQRELIWV